ncbi:4'-phosphopantetheinyl transferase family protein [Myroides guanonis]|uniref:4'-phosphopantetheinyl transferase superfamily protein n=1 Tax=Myroides guanonis TaxID=1150112 RepID=A0A1I3UK33_9FLAO|nr:4'-phosphopantetheinyl transferase superfamily protein [Myroides guanonis]SFJ83262.1 4'-phosphopantetheinyl transferase superfamily protein [Myroides guanonis]
MIGNDVIDLSLSRRESDWQRKGFIQKLFTTKEQRLIVNNSNSETIVWLFWSMKEAAYKIHNRQTKRREFIPQKFECLILTETTTCVTGIVRFLDMVYYTKTDISIEFLHTVAVTSLNDLEDIIQIERRGIGKDEHGIPYLLSAQNKHQQAVSISNHGRFEKVVLIKNKKVPSI